MGVLNTTGQTSRLPSMLLYLLVEKELGDNTKLKRTKEISCNEPIGSYHELFQALVYINNPHYPPR